MVTGEIAEMVRIIRATPTNVYGAGFWAPSRSTVPPVGSDFKVTFVVFGSMSR